ncbi:MAG: DNA-directed RNA polymerase subunit omega [Candidatus Omnitrophica bacterium]|nr:DNA-directed RNA polymerase subunit omega [Candidatus Omnitrophota bacterium]
MSYIPLEKLVTEKSSSLFKLVLLAAARANELAQGAQPLIKSESKKVSTIALQEIAGGVVYYEENAGKGKKTQA